MLEVLGVNKSFNHVDVIKNESFKVNQGEIMGLIGQNGAGKTTSFRMILDLLSPDSGEVLWNGQPISKMNHDKIGYLPEERGLYPKMTVEEQIIFFGELHGMKRRQILHDLDDWMEKFQVKATKKDKIKKLSKGNQQKVQLIAALIFKPELVILDEPFSGLDPVNTDLLKNGIKYLKSLGSTIIFSSHDMHNVEDLSDGLIMLKNGEIVLDGKIDEVRESFGDTRLRILKENLTQEKIEGFTGVRSVNQVGQRFEVVLDDAKYGPEIFKELAADGYIKEFVQQPPTLDEIFKIKAVN